MQSFLFTANQPLWIRLYDYIIAYSIANVSKKFAFQAKTLHVVCFLSIHQIPFVYIFGVPQSHWSALIIIEWIQLINKARLTSVLYR